jgi:hypothetical protein
MRRFDGTCSVLRVETAKFCTAKCVLTGPAVPPRVVQWFIDRAVRNAADYELRKMYEFILSARFSSRYKL